MRAVRLTSAALVILAAGCQASRPSSSPAASPGPSGTSVSSGSPASATASGAARIAHPSRELVATGEPIGIADLAGRIVFDDFENVSTMNPDGSALGVVAGHPGAEFDGAWSPDGEWIVYRDSTRGINEDDEIYVVRADGTDRRNISNNPANDWGPDWSPDGSTIVFNSDRDGSPLQGYLMNPDGSNVRRIDSGGTWFEYPSFSPDGSRIVFEGHSGGSYEVFTIDLTTSEVTMIAGGPGGDGWPVWSPDGTTIAFTSERDDCTFAVAGQPECWRGEPGDIHRDTWLVDADGSNLRRVSTAIGQFLAWSPDGRYLLVSGHALYVVRPDGSGSLELRTPGIPHALGGIPDWWAPEATAAGT